MDCARLLVPLPELGEAQRLGNPSNPRDLSRRSPVAFSPLFLDVTWETKPQTCALHSDYGREQSPQGPAVRRSPFQQNPDDVPNLAHPSPQMTFSVTSMNFQFTKHARGNGPCVLHSRPTTEGDEGHRPATGPMAQPSPVTCLWGPQLSSDGSLPSNPLERMNQKQKTEMPERSLAPEIQQGKTEWWHLLRVPQTRVRNAAPTHKSIDLSFLQLWTSCQPLHPTS